MKKMIFVLVVLGFGCAAEASPETVRAPFCGGTEALWTSNDYECWEWERDEVNDCMYCEEWDGPSFAGPLFDDSEPANPSYCHPAHWLESEHNRCVGSYTLDNGCEYCNKWQGTGDPCSLWERTDYENYFFCTVMACDVDKRDPRCYESEGNLCTALKGVKTFGFHTPTRPCDGQGIVSWCSHWRLSSGVWTCVNRENG